MSASEEREAVRARLDELMGRGRSLSSMGVNGWALTRDQAIVVLEELDAINIAVLGGDVVEVIKERLRYTYDNWHCDALPGESPDVYRIRANEKARGYIENYPVPGRLFSLVVNEI